MISFENNKKSHPDVGLSRQKIDEAEPQQHNSLLVGTYLAFVVTN